MADYSRAKKTASGKLSFDSEAEKKFYREYLAGWPWRVEVHPNYEVRSSYTLGGYKCRSRHYKPDFVVYGPNNKIIHVYDVKASIVPKRGKDRKQKTAKVFVNPSMRKSIDDFQRHYGIPVELVAPMAGRFRMTILGTTVPIGVYEYQSVGYDVSKIIGQ